MIKRVLGLLELAFIVALAVTIFLTMPFMLEAMEEDAVVSTHYVSTIVFFFYAMYKISRSRQGSKDDK